MNRFGTTATPDRPEFEIRVGGTALEPKVAADVVEIDVTEAVGKHGRLALLVQNWDPDSRTVRHSDDGPFEPGAGIEVLLGYHSELTSVFEGVIAAVTTHFPDQRQPVLRVEARSRSFLMGTRPRSRVFEDSSDADVASALASEYDLTADADTGATRAFVVTDRRTDWDYLRARAQQIGWATYVRGSKLVLHEPAAAADTLELEYGLNLTELHLTQDLTHAAESSTARQWDSEVLEAVSSEAGASQAGVDTGKRPDHGAAASDAGWPVQEDTAPTSIEGASDQADLIAVGRQRRAALAHVSGTGAMVGNPALRCDAWVSIAGIGSRMSGPYYVSAARHRVSANGYTTEFQVGIPPALLPSAPAAQAHPLLAPAAASQAALVVALVTDIDDPDSRGRVRVSFPWRSAEEASVWARLATLDAGPEQGTYFIPDVGQEVLVGFIDGDPAYPVVVGSLWNGTQEPPLTLDADKNNLRGIFTRSGHKLLFDDGDDAAITVESAAGSTTVISDKVGSITITEKKSGNAITLSSDGIELNAAKGDIVLKSASGNLKIDAIAIEGKASGPSKLESSATFDIKASGVLGIKGSLVTIN